MNCVYDSVNPAASEEYGSSGGVPIGAASSSNSMHNRPSGFSPRQTKSKLNSKDSSTPCQWCEDRKMSFRDGTR